MDLSNVMDEIAARVDTIADLRVFAYPVAKLTPPAAIVSLPLDYRFDATYGRGMDRMTLPLILVVGRPTDRTARDRLAAYCDGSGASSIKAVVDSGTYTACHTATVTEVEFDVQTIGGTDYLAAVFTIDIAGQGG